MYEFGEIGVMFKQKIQTHDFTKYKKRNNYQKC